MSKHIFIDVDTGIKKSYIETLDNNYIITKFKIKLYNQIDKINSLEIYHDSCYRIPYFKDTIEFYNNIITINCHYSPMHLYPLDSFNIFNIKLNNCFIDHHSMEIEICKLDLVLCIDELYSGFNNSGFKNNNKIKIYSNYFKSIDNLILFIMKISGMTYEQSTNFILENESLYYKEIYYRISGHSDVFIQIY